jgi:hypothetical protein
MRLAHRAEACTADGLFVELGRLASAAAEQQRTDREHENDTDDDTDLDHPVAELLEAPIAEILRARQSITWSASSLPSTCHYG